MGIQIPDRSYLTLHIDTIDTPGPGENEYFEDTSIDGYAFLALARNRLGLEIDWLLESMKYMRVGLNAEWERRDGILLDKYTKYTYSAFPCYELYHELGDTEGCIKTMDVLESIGRYKSGMVRYCDAEIYTEVPNVTALSALMHGRAGRNDDTNAMIGTLKKRQDGHTGNWRYRNRHMNKLYGDGEDTAHLGMMIYSLAVLRNEYGYDTNNLLDRALYCMKNANMPELYHDKTGWSPAFLYAALNASGAYPRLAGRAYNESIRLLGHDNFRVRAIAAWAVTLPYALKRKGRDIPYE